MDQPATTAPESRIALPPDYIAPSVEHVLTAEDLAEQSLYGAPNSPN